MPFAIEVHASTWRTLSRLGRRRLQLTEGWAIDENTMLAITGDGVCDHGTGRAYQVGSTVSGVRVVIHAPGSRVSLSYGDVVGRE